MKTESEIRERLIDSCHSNQNAERIIEANLESDEFIEQLVVIALDEEDYGGDAPMQASFYLSKVMCPEFRGHVILFN